MLDLRTSLCLPVAKGVAHFLRQFECLAACTEGTRRSPYREFGVWVSFVRVLSHATSLEVIQFFTPRFSMDEERYECSMYVLVATASSFVLCCVVRGSLNRSWDEFVHINTS